MGNALAEIFKTAVILIIILFALVVLGLGYFIKNEIKEDIIKTQTKPEITWELKADKQKVDTVWIYKFKNKL
jgi:Tfp pilus assembly protein PilO